MTVEGWKSVFDWGTVILLFLTFAFGAGIVITGGILGKQQEEKARQFEKDLTEAKTKLGEQQERAATAEIRLLELQERVRQRNISPEQEKVLSAALRSMPSKGEVTILCVMGDVEGVAFASQIRGILKSAGWKASDITLDGDFAPNSVNGLVIVRHKNKTAAQAKDAENLRSAFAAAGIPVQIEERADNRPEELRLMIGNKH
jgi:hypothetical protein